MYNDRPEVDDAASAMAGLSTNDNRARSNGPAAWGSGAAANEAMWEEKYVGPRPADFNPTAWIEPKGAPPGAGKENAASQVRRGVASSPPPSVRAWAKGGLDMHTPGTMTSYAKLRQEAKEPPFSHLSTWERRQRHMEAFDAKSAPAASSIHSWREPARGNALWGS
jgi:hypothetical protein